MRETLYKIGALFILILVISLFVKGWLYRKEIAENRKVTVCQYVYCRQAPKTNSATFEYFVNGKLYREEYLQCPENSEEKINKYFILNYSSLDPTKITVDFSEEVKDTSKIIDAGFRLRN